MEIDFETIQKKWQKRWEEAEVFSADDNSDKPKFYCLEMFPYPSALGLHMGHALNYVIGDVAARFKKMQGFNVLHPMGYDALGLPAENAAIKDGTPPEEYTSKAIQNYISQQKALGISYDWSRMISTADPSYYKWDQWIFLKMFEKGLAYQKKSPVNWCPKCSTVLANEQVVNGKCWRHEDTKVKIKTLKQWFLKITHYADELYSGIDNLDWPIKTKAMQKNWIGKSHGTEILFDINGKKWPIFTTRPDTIFGVTFMVISANHPNLWDLVTPEKKEEVERLLEKITSVSEKDISKLEKEGAFTGSYAKNPATGEMVPIYVGNFVLADYGSGMVMGVPAHDKRDFEFAKKYNIPIRRVIDGGSGEAFTGDGILINSGEFNGMHSSKAKEKITQWLSEKGLAKKVTQFKLRDWGISRQRYWGTPIPIIHCKKCGAVPVPEKDLPVVLPKEVVFGKGNPLETTKEWINVKCPKCSSDAKRETDTMDTFVNSSWYFLRYTDPKNDEKIFDEKKADYWCPVDLYIGGSEHACTHLIYFRFYTKFLRDLGLINFDEPVIKLFHQGMLLGEGGERMSKSKGNVVEPSTISKEYGIDTARYFLLSLAEPDKDREWSKDGINGALRFIKKIFKTFHKIEIGKDTEDFKGFLNEKISKITKYIENFRYRLATIELKELFERLSAEKSASRESLETCLKLLCPFAPHISEELFEKIGNSGFVSNSSWPLAKKVEKKEEKEDINEKVQQAANSVINALQKKDREIKKAYIYLIPKDFALCQKEKISLPVKFEVFSTADKEKYDPANKAKKARPGLPAVFVE
ncbi:leucine--tRNA ligase [Candidatus Pacearchaeota archaeon]|nr:MAG: leucine--tRNA ligase [Candidatus Pacearchaeota archaeon]